MRDLLDQVEAAPNEGATAVRADEVMKAGGGERPLCE
jgi:hypothetical protein